MLAYFAKDSINAVIEYWILRKLAALLLLSNGEGEGERGRREGERERKEKGEKVGVKLRAVML